MQIHEITLNEARPMAQPVAQNVAKLKQQRQARSTTPAVARTPATPATPAMPLTTAQQLAQADAAELANRRQRAAQIPGAGPITQAVGNYIAQKIGPRGLPSQRAPGPTQGQLDAEMAKLKNQFPGLTDQQYQQALQQRASKMTAPAGTTVQQPAQPAKPVALAKTTPAPSATTPTTTTPSPAKTYPPITIGNPKDPKATVYVNKGQGYIDSKTGKPIPPSILKAMGPQ